MLKRTVKYHHYWPMMAQMPFLTNSWDDPDNPSEVHKWIKETFKIDDVLSKAVFDSARGAKYVNYHNGYWKGDAMIGFYDWKQREKEYKTNKKK